MYVFIGDEDRTQFVSKNSIQIISSLQERVKKMSFDYFGVKPSDYQKIRAFSAFEIISATSTSVVINLRTTEHCNALFRAGERFYVAINESDEEYKVISSLSDSNGYLEVTVSSTWDNTPSIGEVAGKREFVGVIVDQKSDNIVTLQNQIQKIQAVSLVRVFDKKTINDTFSDKTPRYIVNSFCNSAINYNRVLDDMDYVDDSAVQLIWTATGDGSSPVLSTTYQEGSTAVRFPFTNSGGTATFTGDIQNRDISIWTGVASGTPTKGVMGFWAYATGTVSNVEVRVGSSASDYVSFSIAPTSGWVFYDVALSTSSVTGTPDWTDVDYMQFIVSESATGSLFIDGVRALEEEFFRHYPYVQEGTVFNNFRVARVKPMEVMQRIADEMGWYWRVDDDRYIHLFPESTTPAPIEVTPTSNNFDNLSITWDSSRIVNRQEVEGGDETSEEYYSEIKEGDGFTREWVLKNKFKGLIVKLDDGSVTDTMEGGTTTTTVVATAHGLEVNDFIVNRTQGEARKILTVPDANTFTVEAVTGQTSGDSFSIGVEQDVGVEGINEDLGFDYMSNFSAQSIRASDGNTTLVTGEYVSFKYFQVFPIIVTRSDFTSINAMKTVLGYSDGIFSGQPKVEKNLKTRSETNALARAIIDKYSNTIITASFTTYKNGLEAGQQIYVEDTTGNRNVAKDFIIQSVTQKQIEWGVYKYTVTCSSLLFGMLELLQQILRQQRKIDVDEDLIINNIYDTPENIVIDVEYDILTEDSIKKWGSDPDQFKWNLFEWS